VLHYSANTRQLRADDLIVMDYAGTLNNYASDVTRTFPAGGKFTPEQRKLVEDVWQIQQQLIAAVKPGATLGGLGQMCSELLQQRGYRSDHGPCHHVGLDVHDQGAGTLEPGMLITVEPGAYLRDVGMGCRIEDVVLVTETGCVNLSGHLPSRPDAIELLMAQKGIAQQPVGLPADDAPDRR
jgi:Xaa-Pro aminopeptidase